MVYYKKRIKEAIAIEPEAVQADYLTDFLHLIENEAEVILSMQEVFDSTRATLMIQQAAEQ